MPTHKHAIQCGAAQDMQCIEGEGLQLSQSSLQVGNYVVFMVWATRAQAPCWLEFVLSR